MVNFASLRSAYDVTMETMRNSECKNIRTIAIIAEGIPENMTRRLLRVAKEKEVTIIGKTYRSLHRFTSKWGLCRCMFNKLHSSYQGQLLLVASNQDVLELEILEE